MNKIFLLFWAAALCACKGETSSWRVAYSHDRDGAAISGSVDDLVAAVRRGCAIRVAWGARRRSDPSNTIEHISTPVWVSVRNGSDVEVQLDDFLINLSVLGEPAAEHPERDRFGGVERAVMWRANLKTDGTFDAVWYDAATGEFITRVPQRHGMRWFVDCAPGASEPLYPPAG